jgi:hypothetical protein
MRFALVKQGKPEKSTKKEKFGALKQALRPQTRTDVPQIHGKHCRTGRTTDTGIPQKSRKA